MLIAVAGNVWLPMTSPRRRYAIISQQLGISKVVVCIYPFFISSQFLEHQFTLRTKESHTEHLALLEGESAREDSVRYGINRDSALNELSYFHVCSGGLLPDIMHDLLEGALQYETKLMLQQFILREKYITLDEFNNRLERFELGYMEEKDRPSPISDTTLRSESSNTLKQAGMSNMHGYWSLGQGWYMYILGCHTVGGSSPSPSRQKFFDSHKILYETLFMCFNIIAAQMWLFGRVLPLLIGDRVPEDDEHWSNYLRMMEIVSPGVLSTLP